MASSAAPSLLLLRPPVTTANPKIPKRRSIRSLLVSSKTLIKPYSSNSSSSSRRDAISLLKSSTDLDSALSSAGEALQLQDLNSLLRHFGETRRWRQVSQIFEWMQRNERLNFASYSSFIKYMGLSRNPVKALQVYDSISEKSMKINVSICNSILGCLVRNGRFDSSIKLFDQMKDGGLLPDLVTYSTLLSGCAKLKDGYSKAMELVNELNNNGLHMDGVIYGNLLAVCASNGLREEAEIFFQQMKNEGCTPNLFHYSSLLNGYSEGGNYVEAEKLIEDLKSSGLVPNKAHNPSNGSFNGEDFMDTMYHQMYLCFGRIIECLQLKSPRGFRGR